MICRTCLRTRSTVAGAEVTLLRLQALRQPVFRPQPQATRALSSISTLRSTLPKRVLRSTPSTVRPFSAAAPQESTAPQLVKPADLTEGESQVWDILIRELEPTQLVVQDVSGGCGSMYAVDVSSERFRGLNMLKQQRMVNSALGDLVKEWHGVQIRTSVP